MRSLRTTLAAAALALTMAGCTSSTFGLTPQPDGNIVVSDPTSGATLTTSAANPYQVNSGSFAVGIYEKYFGGPYTVQVVQWAAGFNIPCFVPHYVSTVQQTNVVAFRDDNAAPISNPSQPNPCFSGESEMASIADSKGHSVNFYYQLTVAQTKQSLDRYLNPTLR